MVPELHLGYYIAILLHLFNVGYSVCGPVFGNVSLCTDVWNALVITWPFVFELWAMCRCFKCASYYTAVCIGTLAYVQMFQMRWLLHGCLYWNFGLCAEVSNVLVITWPFVLELWPMCRCFKCASYYMAICIRTFAYVQMFQIHKLVIMWSCVLKLWPVYICFKYTSQYMTTCSGTLACVQMFSIK